MNFQGRVAILEGGPVGLFGAMGNRWRSLRPADQATWFSVAGGCQGAQAKCDITYVDVSFRTDSVCRVWVCGVRNMLICQNVNFERLVFCTQLFAAARDLVAVVPNPEQCDCFGEPALEN